MIKNYIILPVLLVAFIVFAIGHFASAQSTKQVIVKKECVSTSQLGDSVQVIIKTIGDCVNSESISNSQIHTICTELNSEDGLTKIIKIENGDTIIKEFEGDSLAHLFMGKFHDYNIQQVITDIESHVDLVDSTGNFVFNVVFDPINWENETVELLAGEDSVIVKTINVQVKDGDCKNQFIVIGDDGENIRIEKDGELVFINKEDCIKTISSDIDMIQEENGEKVIVLQTRIVLEDISDSESKNLKSQGIKTSSKAPEFDYIKFYPNPSKEDINIQFKLAKQGDIKVRISNMLGQEIFQEDLKDYNGEYMRTVNLKQYGEGTYIMQIIQGKRVITRKIIVE